MRNRAKEVMIWCRDISCKGIGIFASEPLCIKDKVNVLLYFDNDPTPLSVFCNVAWCEMVGQNRYRAGLEFVNVKLSDYGRLSKLLCKKITSLEDTT